MDFVFYQWRPDAELPNLNHINGGDAEFLLQLWRHWRLRFSSALKVVTLTKGEEGAGGSIEMRFWLGEPESIKRNHADSKGRNLLLEVSETYRPLQRPHLEHLRDSMVGSLQFTKEWVNDVEVWRRK